MRENAQKILFLLLCFALAAVPSAHAKPRKHAATTAPKASGTKARASRKEAKSNKAKGNQPQPSLARTPGKHGRSRYAAASSEAAAREPAPAPQPEIHVTHDRKQHHGVPPTASLKGKTHRDSIQVASVKISKPPAEIPENTHFAAEPIPVISIIRPTSARPQLPSIADEVISPVILPTLYDTRGHLVMPPPLKGSHEILLHQNQMAEQDGLVRIKDDDDIIRMRSTYTLVPIPLSNALVLDYRLPANRRYVRPWAAQFLITLAQAHNSYFHTPLQVNSAVRTVEFQQKLIHTNGNAAPAEGETASPHLTGQAVDIAKHGLSAAEIAWMRAYLLPLVQEGKIDVEEEFQQACFHISVYKKSFTPEPLYRNLPTTHRGSESSLALEIGSDY